MRCVRAIDIQVFNRVAGTRNGLCVYPAICLGGMLRFGAAQKKRGTGDERRIDSAALSRLLTVDVEAKVPRLLVRAPFEEHRAVSLRERVKSREVNGGRRLDG